MRFASGWSKPSPLEKEFPFKEAPCSFAPSPGSKNPAVPCQSASVFQHSGECPWPAGFGMPIADCVPARVVFGHLS